MRVALAIASAEGGVRVADGGVKVACTDSALRDAVGDERMRGRDLVDGSHLRDCIFKRIKVATGQLAVPATFMRDLL